MLCLKSSSLLSCAILLTIAADIIQSKYVFNAKFHRKVAQYKNIATWEEAKLRCESEGATLASPISEELLQYMRAIITVNNHTTPYFIGFKAKNNTEFRSEEGVLLEDVAEAFDMVEQMDPMEGDCLCMDAHSIRIEPCLSRLPFICYTNDTSVKVSAAIPEITPKEDYKQYSTGRYELHKQKMTWDEAYWTCYREGAHLVVINDSDEAKVISQNFGHSWVGLRKEENSQHWMAITGEPVDKLYHKWWDAHNSAPCVYLMYSGHLEDIWCDEKFPFVCEK